MKEKIIALIAERVAVDPDDCTDNANFKDDLGCDSLDKLDLIMTLELEFDISIPDDTHDNIDTVGDMVKVVESTATHTG